MTEEHRQKLRNQAEGTVDEALNYENTHVVFYMNSHREWFSPHWVAVGESSDSSKEAFSNHLYIYTVDLSEEVEPQIEELMKKV